MAQILRDKALATKFQILVEIAASQPNIRQKDIASKLSVSPQAISEYIEKLVKDALVISDGRSKYRVTKEGIDWVLKMIREVRAYFLDVEKSIVGTVICTAVADCDLSRAQPVGLVMKSGLLVATEVVSRGARGITTSSARKGEGVGISDIEGIVELEMGEITIGKIPSIQRGGSSDIDLARLKRAIVDRKLVGAIGIESLLALRQIGIEPHYFYGVKEAIVEAAHCGLSSVVVCTDEEMSGLLQTLERESLGYELLDLRRSNKS
jgi:putative transcriptional regulator